MIRLVIVQGEVPHYRRPFFEALGSRANLDVVVLHSGQTHPSPPRRYTEVTVPVLHVANKIFLQQKVARYIWQADVAVLMFDIRWIHNIVAALAGCRVPVLLWGHGLGRSHIGNYLRILTARRSAGVITYGTHGKQQLAARGVPTDSVTIAPNTLHVPEWARYRGDEDKRTEYLFVGRLQPRKRVEQLLEGFAMSRWSLPESFAITVVGDGPERRRLATAADEFGIKDAVNFVSASNDPYVLKRHFDRALAYVSPGPVGLGLLHSFAHAVPVVTAAGCRHGPEVESLVDGLNGVLYDGTTVGLAEVLNALAGRPEYAVRMGEAAASAYWRSRRLQHMVEPFAHAVERAYHLSSRSSHDPRSDK